MSGRARYLFTVSMDIDPEKEELFNELYDSEHLPFLRAVPGVVSARHTVAEPLVAVLRGDRQEVLSGARRLRRTAGRPAARCRRGMTHRRRWTRRGTAWN